MPQPVSCQKVLFLQLPFNYIVVITTHGCVGHLLMGATG